MCSTWVCGRSLRAAWNSVTCFGSEKGVSLAFIFTRAAGGRIQGAALYFSPGLVALPLDGPLPPCLPSSASGDMAPRLPSRVQLPMKLNFGCCSFCRCRH